MANTAVPSDPNAVRNAARDILSRPEFRSKPQHWWDKVIYYATHPGDLLNLVFGWVLEKYFEGTLRQEIFAWGLTAVLAGLIIFLIVRFVRSATSDQGVRVQSVTAAHEQSSRELLEEAKAFEAKGDWRNAIRSRYGALIAQLAAQSVVVRRSGRTTGEYQREVAVNAPRAAGPFSAGTNMFERVWYGDHDPKEADAAAFRRVAEDVAKQVAS